MAFLQELWLLTRMHRMLDRAEKQFLTAAFESRDGNPGLHDAFLASARRYEARYQFYEAEYIRVRERRGSARPEAAS